MIRTHTDALEDLVARLDRAGFGAHVRLVKLGVRRLGACTITIPGGSIVVRPPRGAAEGPTGALVADVQHDGKRTIVRATAPTNDAAPRRSVRIDEDTWARIGAHGEHSSVIRDAIERHLAALERGQ